MWTFTGICLHMKIYVCAGLFVFSYTCACVSHSHAKAKAKELGGVVLGFAAAYYEDHVQPVTDPYFEWAASARSSFWERVQKTVDNYTPFKSD